MSAGYNGGHKTQKEVILMAGFHDIIGHDDIIRHLKNAIETGKVSHSYIFTGEPGSGKKLLAGTFAAALQCESGESEPCMACDSCKKVIGKMRCVSRLSMMWISSRTAVRIRSISFRMRR